VQVTRTTVASPRLLKLFSPLWRWRLVQTCPEWAAWAVYNRHIIRIQRINNVDYTRTVLANTAAYIYINSVGVRALRRLYCTRSVSVPYKLWRDLCKYNDNDNNVVCNYTTIHIAFKNVAWTPVRWHSGAKTTRWTTTSSRQFISQWQCWGNVDLDQGRHFYGRIWSIRNTARPSTRIGSTIKMLRLVHY